MSLDENPMKRTKGSGFVEYYKSNDFKKIVLERVFPFLSIQNLYQSVSLADKFFCASLRSESFCKNLITSQFERYVSFSAILEQFKNIYPNPYFHMLIFFHVLFDPFKMCYLKKVFTDLFGVTEGVVKFRRKIEKLEKEINQKEETEFDDVMRDEEEGEKKNRKLGKEKNKGEKKMIRMRRPLYRSFKNLKSILLDGIFWNDNRHTMFDRKSKRFLRYFVNRKSIRLAKRKEIYRFEPIPVLEINAIPHEKGVGKDVTHIEILEEKVIRGIINTQSAGRTIGDMIRQSQTDKNISPLTSYTQLEYIIFCGEEHRRVDMFHALTQISFDGNVIDVSSILSNIKMSDNLMIRYDCRPLNMRHCIDLENHVIKKMFLKEVMKYYILFKYDTSEDKETEERKKIHRFELQFRMQHFLVQFFGFCRLFNILSFMDEVELRKRIQAMIDPDKTLIRNPYDKISIGTNDDPIVIDDEEEDEGEIEEEKEKEKEETEEEEILERMEIEEDDNSDSGGDDDDIEMIPAPRSLPTPDVIEIEDD